MNDKGIGSWAARRARMSPDTVALVEDGTPMTYGEVELRSRRLAHGLRGLGVRRGDRVAYLGLNSVDLVLTLFATARLGAVFVPLNTRLAPAETAYILGNCSPEILVHGPGFEEIVGAGEVTALGIPLVPTRDGAGTTVTSLTRDDEDAPLDEEVGLDDLFMIQYTSGTSGRPKGVMLTHGNITWNVYNLLVDLDLRHDDRSLVTAPLFHTAALNQLLLPTFLKGGTSYIEPRWDPERAYDLIEDEGITVLFGVTSMYLMLAQHPRWEGADLSRLRITMSGGSPLPLALLETYAERDLPIIQGYGLTEASPGTTMLREAEVRRKIGTAGTPCFFTDIRIVDLDLEDVGTDVPGEVLVSGPNVSPGYWQDPDATETSRVDGAWLRTGDLGRTDDEGYLTVVDRLKDMIISGGENIYPAEVEQAIHSHPGVAEVAVIGVPDEKWGEVGRAVVVPRAGSSLTPDDVLAHLEGRIARYKVPKSVVIADALPHNASGKLVKARVRELFAPTPEEGGTV
jgi:fatty-acyl-CoA synthase